MKRALVLLTVVLASSPALADPVGYCGTGRPCSVTTLKATSSSSTSCLQIDGNVLKVDCVNNRVGVNMTPAAGAALDVTGNVRVNGTAGGAFCLDGGAACLYSIWSSGGSVVLNSAVEGSPTYNRGTQFSPWTSNFEDLGATTLQWRDFFLSRTLYQLGADPSAFAALPDGTNTHGEQLFDNSAFKSAMQANVHGHLRYGGFPDPAQQRRMGWSAYPNESTTIINVGHSTAPTVTDAAAATTNTNDTTRYHRNLVTAASAGSTSSYLTGDTTKVGYTPAWGGNLRTDQSAVTSSRIWAGLTDRTVAQMNADDPASGNFCAFRYSTDAADTNWTLCTKDGTTISCVSTGVAVAAATSYVMRLELTTGGCWGYISSGSGVTFAAYRQRRLTNLPGSAANLKGVTMLEARAASARSLGFNNLTFETR